MWCIAAKRPGPDRSRADQSLHFTPKAMKVSRAIDHEKTLSVSRRLPVFLI
jgi:hypothetical protein